MSIRGLAVRLESERPAGAGEDAKEAQAMSHYLLEVAATGSTKASIMPGMPGRSRATQWSVGLLAAIGLTASVLASLTTWLLITDPVTVSSAISTRDAEVLTRVIGTALIDIVRVLVGYL
jgi:hypothetical protein